MEGSLFVLTDGGPFNTSAFVRSKNSRDLVNSKSVDSCGKKERTKNGGWMELKKGGSGILNGSKSRHKKEVDIRQTNKSMPENKESLSRR